MVLSVTVLNLLDGKFLTIKKYGRPATAGCQTAHPTVYNASILVWRFCRVLHNFECIHLVHVNCHLIVTVYESPDKKLSTFCVQLTKMLPTVAASNVPPSSTARVAVMVIEPDT